MSIIANNLLQGDDGYLIQRSLRFRSSASAYLSRTPVSAGNRKTWTYSAWVKRGAIGTTQILLSTNGASDTTLTSLRFETDDKLYVGVFNTGSVLVTTQVFRDPSAWYHIVMLFDTTQATASNRCRLFVNGSEITSFSTDARGTYFAQNTDYGINSTQQHAISRNNYSGAQYFDGYLTDVHFIDGQALTPSSFGETDSVTGVWKPKKYAGTYGTNGFYLPFSDNSSNTATTIGKDYSGNGNNWTPNNISVTAGATYDSMTDVPTMSALGSNYAVWNPLVSAGGNITCVNANLQTQIGSFGNNSVATMGVTSGKWYWEVSPTFTNNGSYWYIGVSAQGYALATQPDADSKQWAYYAFNGNKKNGADASYGASYTTNDIIGVALDMDAGTLTFYKNGVSQGQAFSNLAGNIIFPSCSFGNTGSVYFVGNFGQRPFSYTPPTGFKALNTFNLPDATIKAGNKHFDVSLYTGNGSTQTISGLSFAPDLVWIKSRSNVLNNQLFNIIQGTGKGLVSNSTGAEFSDADSLQSFTSDGYTLGPSAHVNTNSATFVGWQWKAGGSAVSNTAGSITSQVSANPSAGFSVVTYTGNNTSGATVGHGLGVAPKMIITKQRNGADSWNCYHASLGNDKAIFLNQTATPTTASSFWNNTTPTSSVFTLGNAGTNQNNNVAYCFSAVQGYSAFTSYTGNGSADGPFIFTGFLPRFILIKRTDAVSNWSVWDTARSAYNSSELVLAPNISDAEQASGAPFDILSNGFKIRNTGNSYGNTSNGTYIVAAFASNPFKHSLAR